MPRGMEHELATAIRCRHIDAVLLASGHPGVSAGVAGRVTAPLRMYEPHRAMHDRRSQGLRLSCAGL